MQTIISMNPIKAYREQCEKLQVTYSVEWLEGSQEHVNTDHEYLSEMKEDLPIVGVVVKPSVQEAKSCHDRLLAQSLSEPVKYTHCD